MTFGNPLLLAGTALVALPIVLHLIMRQRPKLLEFPALRFVRQKHDANRRRLLLQHLLLLLLRAAVIALLATALALPSISFSGSLGSQEAPVAAVLVFDTAPRMAYRHRNRSRLEVAAESGQWILTQLPSRSEVAVLDTRQGPAVLQDDLGFAKEQIERLRPVAKYEPLTAVVEKALELAAGSEHAQKEIYIFTDLAESAWPASASGPLQEALANVPGVAIYLIDVGVQEPVNLALGPLRLSGQVLSNRSTLAVETELTRTGPAAECAVELHLLDAEGKPQKRSESSHILMSDQTQEIGLQVRSLEVGTHQGFVRIVGQDALEWDDKRYFTVEVRPAWRVLVAAPQPTARRAVYLTEALAPAMFRKRGQARFDCEVIDFDALTRRRLDDYAAVYLLDPRPLDPAMWQRLGNYASQGGGVAIFLGRDALPTTSFNAPRAQDLLPGELLLQVPRDADFNFHLAPQQHHYQHPIMAEFAREFPGRVDAIPWKAFPVRRYWQLGDLADDVGAVLPYLDGEPALLERPVGSGRVLTMTTPISDDPNRDPWNFLPVGEAWPFGMLANGIATYLVGSSRQQFNYLAGLPASLQPDAAEPRGNYLMTGPEGLKQKLTPDPKTRVLSIPTTDRVGNYRIEADGPPKVIRGFSVNLAEEQTQLHRIAEESLTELFQPHTFRLACSQEEIERAQHRGRVGREMFPLLIVLVAVMLAAEHLVANRFYRE